MKKTPKLKVVPVGKRLSLTTQTVRPLDSNELDTVVGGMMAFTNTWCKTCSCGC